MFMYFHCITLITIFQYSFYKAYFYATQFHKQKPLYLSVTLTTTLVDNDVRNLVRELRNVLYVVMESNL